LLQKQLLTSFEYEAVTLQEAMLRGRNVDDINWFESFGVSQAYMAVFLGLACWRFARRDY
jgi:hypothetical protein